jgi:dipeptidase
MRPLSCDTLVALGNSTQQGQTIFAKNSDRPADECQPLVLQPRQVHANDTLLHCQFVNLPQAKTTYRHIGSRPYWCWGYEHGFNEFQVVIGNEALHSKLPEASEPKLIGMEILRLGLERSRTAAEAVAVMTGLISTYGQGKFANAAGVRTYDNGYIIADPHEAYVLETAGHEWVVKRVTGALGISNVYSVTTDWVECSPQAEAVAQAQGWWQGTERFNFADAYTVSSRSEGSGALRRGRSCALLGQQAGAITARTMMAVLSDHADGSAPQAPWQNLPNPGFGICMHPNAQGKGSCSAASLVAELCADGTRLPIYWCSLYSPCLSLFLPIFLQGELPPILTQGNATPSEHSPWWRFHEVNRLVMRDPACYAPRVRAYWQPLQHELLTSAATIAQRGQQLVSDNRPQAALTLVSDYMAENASRMMRMVSALAEELRTQGPN